MGLDVSHDCWSGGYGSFNAFREAVAAAVGIYLPGMQGFGGTGRWDRLRPDPIHALLDHSDCDGTLGPHGLVELADRLVEIAAILDKGSGPRDVEFAGRARQFAAGLREAAELGEVVEFH